MPKTLTEAALTTRAARAKLPPGLHFRSIDPEVHLGYRKGKRAGVWLVRWRNWGPGANYLQAPLGTADDELKEGTLDFEAAKRAARARADKVRREAAAAAEGSVPTVRSAVETYIGHRDARDSRRKGKPVRSDAGSGCAAICLARTKGESGSPLLRRRSPASLYTT